MDLESIYKKYPRKRGKTRGMKKLVKEIKTKKQFENLDRAVLNYSRSVSKTDPQYILYFSTFASEWEDWVDPEPEPGSINVTPLYFGETDECE